MAYKGLKLYLEKLIVKRGYIIVCQNTVLRGIFGLVNRIRIYSTMEDPDWTRLGRHWSESTVRQCKRRLKFTVRYIRCRVGICRSACYLLIEIYS